MRKNIIYSACVGLCSMFMLSCSADMDVKLENDNSGNSGEPRATVYQYEAPAGYNPDNDTQLRFVFTSNVEKAYYLAELQADKVAFVEENGENAYIQHVIDNGAEASIDESTNSADVTLTGLKGMNEISVVAVGKNGAKYIASTTFEGIIWNDVCKGTYYFSVLANALGAASKENVQLQVAESNPNMYRLVNLYNPSYPVKFTKLPDYVGEDEGGVYNFIRVQHQKVGLTYGPYGDIFIQDIGYWQGDDSFVLQGGYQGGMYEDNNIFFYVQYGVSAGNLGYNYEFFEPNVD